MLETGLLKLIQELERELAQARAAHGTGGSEGELVAAIVGGRW